MGPQAVWLEAGSWPVLLPLPTGHLCGAQGGPGFAFQNSKPDSLLKMEEEQKLEKSPLPGSKDTKFSFSFSNKRLLGYVSTYARRCWGHRGHTSHMPLIPRAHTCHVHTTPHTHRHTPLEGSLGEAPQAG